MKFQTTDVTIIGGGFAGAKAEVTQVVVVHVHENAPVAGALPARAEIGGNGRPD